MIAALKVFWLALRHLNQRGYLYIWANFAAVVCSLPVVTAPAAWAGLVRLSYQEHVTGVASLEDFRDGFIQNLGRGLLLSLLNAIIIGINVVNLLSYSGQTGLLVMVLRMVWLLTLALWFSIQFYMWAIFYHMEQPTLWGAMRNALLMILLNPLFTLVLWLGIALLLAVSSLFVVAWLLLTISALAVIATQAALNRLGVILPDDAAVEHGSEA